MLSEADPSVQHIAASGFRISRFRSAVGKSRAPSGCFLHPRCEMDISQECVVGCHLQSNGKLGGLQVLPKSHAIKMLFQRHFENPKV